MAGISPTGWAIAHNLQDGYDFGDFTLGFWGIDRSKNNGTSQPSPNSAVSAANGPLSFEQYTGQNYGILNRVDNIFSGKLTSAEKAYEQYLSDYEFKRNQEAAKAANRETYQREDSAIQRLMEDYKKAGLNPYLLLNGGNISAASSSPAQRATYKRRSKTEGVDDKLASSALKILTLVLLKKML